MGNSANRDFLSGLRTAVVLLEKSLTIGIFMGAGIDQLPISSDDSKCGPGIRCCISMNRSTSLLLAIVVLAHSLAGCCSHHAHATEPGENATCCGHDHAHEHSDNGSDGKQPVESCDEGHCVFLRGDSSPLIDTDLVLSFDGCVTVTDQIGSDALLAAHAWVADSQEPAPHARIHLLHQILLI